MALTRVYFGRAQDLKRQGRPEGRPWTCVRTRDGSVRIVHFVFDRMGRHLEALDVEHLELDVAVDEVVVEYVAGLEEGAVSVEAGERFSQGSADRRDLLQFLRRQVVEVLVHRRAGIDLVL